DLLRAGTSRTWRSAYPISQVIQCPRSRQKAHADGLRDSRPKNTARLLGVRRQIMPHICFGELRTRARGKLRTWVDRWGARRLSWRETCDTVSASVVVLCHSSDALQFSAQAVSISITEAKLI